MAEAAGLALATVSLLGQSLGGCQTAFQFARIALSLGDEYEKYRWRLRMENSRLMLWGEEWNESWKENSAISRLLDQSASDTLKRMTAVLRKISDMQDKYGETKTESEDLIKAAALLLPSSVNNDSRADLAGQILEAQLFEARTQEAEAQKEARVREAEERLKKTAKWTKKFKWAFDDEKKFAQCMAELKDCNNFLRDFLPTRPHSDRIWMARLLQMIETSNTGELEGVAQVATEASYRDLSEAIGLLHIRRRAEIAETRQSTELRSMFPSDQVTLNIPKTSLLFEGMSNPGEIPPVALGGNEPTRLLAKYHPPGTSDVVTVLVQWIANPEGPGDDPGEEIRLANNRIDALARLLGADFNQDTLSTLHCLGYFGDSTGHQTGHYRTRRFGFVLQIPHEALPCAVPPVTLHECLVESSGRSKSDLPALDARFRLIRTICQTVFTLHASAWLHKAISSHNILIFRLPSQSSALRSVRTAEDYLWVPFLTGFDWSRPDHPNQLTTARAEMPPEIKLYSHPSSLATGPTRPRYCMEYDLYGVGLAVFEIGIWMPLESNMRLRPAEIQAYDPLALKQRIIDKEVRKMGFLVGTELQQWVRHALELTPAPQGDTGSASHEALPPSMTLLQKLLNFLDSFAEAESKVRN